MPLTAARGASKKKVEQDMYRSLGNLALVASLFLWGCPEESGSGPSNNDGGSMETGGTAVLGGVMTAGGSMQAGGDMAGGVRMRMGLSEEDVIDIAFERI